MQQACMCVERSTLDGEEASNSKPRARDEEVRMIPRKEATCLAWQYVGRLDMLHSCTQMRFYF